MISKALLFFALPLLLLASHDCPAWGPQGHRVTGHLTEPLLSAETRAVVRQLLGEQSLADASTWADRMRSSPSRFWQERAGPFHYVTVSPGRTYADVGAPAKGDSVTALADFGETLRDPDAQHVQKQLALRFAIHIIQDLHQPLHVGKGDDRGGNDFRVKVNGKSSNLHRVWDSAIIRSAGRSDRSWVRKLTPIPRDRKAEWWEPDPETWIAESAALRDTIYPQSRVLDDAYLQRYLPVVSKRMQQAAVRTAAWLDEVLGKEGS